MQHIVSLEKKRFLGDGGGGVPQILGPGSKIEYTSDHLAKFHVDRPRSVRDIAMKKRKKKHLQ